MTARPWQVAGERLVDHGIDLDDEVEVEVLVQAGQSGRLIITGIVEQALAEVLVLRRTAGGTRVRVRWAAIATIATPVHTHPANR